MQMQPQSSPSATLTKGLWTAFYSLGVIGSLVVYGLFQERIMSFPYDGEYFEVSVFLVLVNRLEAVIFVLGLILASGEQLAPIAPPWTYLAISGTNVIGTTCQYEALRWISFPAQMLGKSFKMIPVMIWGMTMSEKVYKTQDWGVAGAITVGVVQVMLSGPINSPDAHEMHSSTCGLVLLAVFVSCDGFTSSMQERLFTQHKTTTYNQMLWINAFSGIISLGLLLLTGTLWTALNFCSAHPAFIMHVFVLSTAATISQWFMLSQVRENGALVLAMTMNVRQVTSILISYVRFGHPVNSWQILGLCIVFGAIAYRCKECILEVASGKGEKQALISTAARLAALESACGKTPDPRLPSTEGFATYGAAKSLSRPHAGDAPTSVV